jgi:hypothetical protein
VQTFAAQAVIAIENARLLNELRESLDRQTATADILRVIAGTPEDSKRALDTIAETASRMSVNGLTSSRSIPNTPINSSCFSIGTTSTVPPTSTSGVWRG